MLHVRVKYNKIHIVLFPGCLLKINYMNNTWCSEYSLFVRISSCWKADTAVALLSASLLIVECCWEIIWIFLGNCLDIAGTFLGFFGYCCDIFGYSLDIFDIVWILLGYYLGIYISKTVFILLHGRQPYGLHLFVCCS